MTRAAVVVALVCGCAQQGGGDAADVDASDGDDVVAEEAETSSGLTFEIATHPWNQHRPQSTHLVEDRSALEVIVGAQGLKMALLVPRIHGEVTLPVTAMAELESGPSLLGRVDRELEPPHTDFDGAQVFHDLVIIIAPELQVPDDWARLRVVLTDGAGRRAEERRTVRLVLPSARGARLP